VLILSRLRFIGASGTTDSLIIAPFPSIDADEDPIILFAIIYAKTLVPVNKFHGAVINFYTFIVQLNT